MALTSAGLARVLPNGTAVYVALGTAGDPAAGTMTELSGNGYARKSHSAWVSQVVDGVIRRRNNGAVVFDAFSATVEGIAWWGIYDAAVAGNLIAVGPLLNGSGVPEAQTVTSGDQPRFNDGELRLISTPEEV